MYKNDKRPYNISDSANTNHGNSISDNRAHLLSQLPASTKVETILKTEPPDPEASVNQSGSTPHLGAAHPYLGGGDEGGEFFPDIETPGAGGMAGPMHSLEDDDFLNAIEQVGQGFNPHQNANHNNIKKEVDAYNEYQVGMNQCNGCPVWFFYPQYLLVSCIFYCLHSLFLIFRTGTHRRGSQKMDIIMVMDLNLRQLVFLFLTIH